MSAGGGREATTGASRGWTRVFLKARPQKTGASVPLTTPARRAARSGALPGVFGWREGGGRARVLCGGRRGVGVGGGARAGAGGGPPGRRGRRGEGPPGGVKGGGRGG